MSDTQPDLWTAGNKTRQWLLANVVLSILFMNIPSLVGAGMVLAGERLPLSRLGELQCAAQTQQWAALYGGAVAILFWALLAVEPGLVLIALGYTAQTVVTFLAGKRLRDEIARVQPQPLGAGGSAQQLVPVVDAQVLEAASAQPAQQQTQQVSQQPPSQEQQSDARSQRAPAQPRQPPVTMASHPGSTPPRDAGQQYQYDLFLTHDWGLNSENHQRVSRVNEALKARGYRTWFDTEKMHGNIHDQMTAGIDMSELVIVFVTNRYTVKVASSNHNDNCKLEFNYAKMQKTAGRMIPVVMEPDMRNTSRWKGMVGLILGSELHVDMSADDAPTRAHLDELDELIKRKREAIAALAAQGMAT